MAAEILFLKQEDVVKAGLLDMKQALAASELTYKMFGEGSIINHPKVSTKIPDEDNWTAFFNSMPCYIGGDIHMAGIKWACEATGNLGKPDLPWGIDSIILSDPDTVLPIAYMDGTLITAMRTSAVGGIFAKYTAPKGCKKAVLLGAGVIGRTMIMAICEALPGIEEILLCDLVLEKAQGLADEFKGVYDVKITPCTDADAALKQCSLIVTQTTSTKPIVHAHHVSKGDTVIAMSTSDVDLSVGRAADQVFVDYYHQMITNKIKTVYGLHQEGKLTEDNVVELKHLAMGTHPGRKSEDETIFCASMGFAALDIMLAQMIYKNAKSMGIGQTIHLWDNPLWV